MIKTPDSRARIITKKMITVIVISYISISVFFFLKIELLATGQLGIGLMFLIYKMHRTYLTGCQLSDKPYLSGFLFILLGILRMKRKKKKAKEGGLVSSLHPPGCHSLRKKNLPRALAHGNHRFKSAT
jgi:hypothetical protein